MRNALWQRCAVSLAQPRLTDMVKSAGTAIKQIASVCFAGRERQWLLAILVLVGSCFSPFGAFVNAQQKQDKPIDLSRPYHAGWQSPTAEESATLDRIYDLKFRDLHVRVPGWYITNDPNIAGKWSIAPAPPTTLNIEFSFSFWVSDSKPLKIRGSMQDIARWQPFWPPEPGRPTSGSEDFLVGVYHVSQLDVETVESRRKSRLARTGDVHVDDGYGLYCNGGTCTSAPTDDPTVSIIKNGRFYRASFLSRTDGITGTFGLPLVGYARWREVTCKSLSLIRSWRVSEASMPAQ